MSDQGLFTAHDFDKYDKKRCCPVASRLAGGRSFLYGLSIGREDPEAGGFCQCRGCGPGLVISNLRLKIIDCNLIYLGVGFGIGIAIDSVSCNELRNHLHGRAFLAWKVPML